ERVGIRLLRGTESDLLADGALDYPDAILEKLDVIIGSVHNRFHLDEEEMTRRLVRAMRLPVFKIWGHPLGRLLLRREPLACRMSSAVECTPSFRLIWARWVSTVLRLMHRALAMDWLELPRMTWEAISRSRRDSRSRKLGPPCPFEAWWFSSALGTGRTSGE